MQRPDVKLYQPFNASFTALPGRKVNFVLCMFRPCTGMLVMAAIVLLPMSIVVPHPEAVRGMPF